MNIGRFRDRLTKIEAMTATKASHDYEAELQCRQDDLKLMASDYVALGAYNDLLLTVAKVRCAHSKDGGCWQCIHKSEAVQRDWIKYATRMNDLRQGNDVPHTGG